MYSESAMEVKVDVKSDAYSGTLAKAARVRVRLAIDIVTSSAKKASSFSAAVPFKKP